MTKTEELLIKSSIEQKATNMRIEMIQCLVPFLFIGLLFYIIPVLIISEIVFAMGICHILYFMVKKDPENTQKDLLEKLEELVKKDLSAEEAIKELKL